MSRTIYEIPSTVKELFEQSENNYRIIDYTIKDMDNIEALEYFINCVGIIDDNIESDYGTEIILNHPDFDYKLVIDSHGLGDFFSHGFAVSLFID